MKKSQKNLVKLISLIMGLLLISTMIMVAVITVNKKNKLQGGVIDSELAKAMTYPEVQEEEEKLTETPNIEFDAFFLRDINGDGYAESLRGTCREIGKEDTLYMELNVQTAGYLKNAKISINGENMYLQTSLPKDNELKENYIGSNIKTIEFNDISNGTQKMITGIVRSGDYKYSSSQADAIGNNINNYSKVNSVTLTGIYVGEDQTETPISKTVNFNVDWYGKTTADIYIINQEKYLEDAINEKEKKITIDFTIYTQETKKELIISKNYLKGEIPLLNGYEPTTVEYMESTGQFNYDQGTRTFTIEKTAVVNEDGTVKSTVGRSNSYRIKVVYPLEAYESSNVDTLDIKIPVETYYEGYNNQSSEFTNPYKSNTDKATIVINYGEPKGTVAKFTVEIGKWISEPSSRYMISKEKPLKIYNGISEEEKNDTYTVKWKAYIGTNQNTSEIIMKETKNGQPQVTDKFIKTDATEESMENVASNTGIYFSGADKILGTEGSIKVYDEETGNLLVTFTSKDWNKYTSNNPFKYEIPVKHIRIETSVPVNDESYLYVYNIKELDDEYITTNYTKENFDGLQYIKSTLEGYLGENHINTSTHRAVYEAPTSIAEISISKNTLSTQVTEKNVEIKIEANANTSANQIMWKDGTFLIKLPKEILDVQINDIRTSNSSVLIENYELIENEEGKFIKIVTKNESPTNYTITIKTDITPDPRKETATRKIELYATNENAVEYYYKEKDKYDVNNNLNKEEYVNYRSISLSIVAPNSLLTNQIATDFDDKGSEVVSPQTADLKPIYAVVDQENVKEQTVKIGVQLKNNYTSTISEIQILGKIPFEGNTYVLSGGDLGSTFTTKMTEVGIEIPEEIKQYVTIYYSEKENPSKEITDEANGWKTKENVTNWDNIKTYIINFGNYVMPTGKEFVFNYTVKIPNGIEFNKVTYSHHGIYFCLDTDEGKYRTQTEPNRLGLRIAEKFDLEMTKYRTGKENIVPGATYSITEIITTPEGEQTGEVKTGTTNAYGKLTIMHLYAEKTYEIKEIKTPKDYELNPEVIRFIGHVDEKGTLTIEKKQGTTKGEIEVIKNAGENYKVSLNVEDEVNASLKIIKREKTTNNLLKGIRFKITGKGLTETGRIITTNTKGEAILKGISVNQEYTIEEVKTQEGYYLEPNTTKFKVVNNSGTYELQIIEGTPINQSISEIENMPTVEMTFENEKIPTYDLQLIKIKKVIENTSNNGEGTTETKEYLSGAKFRLYKGTEEIGDYITGEDGTVRIEGLYQYVAEKGIEQTYTLKEILAPAGYAKVKDIKFKTEIVNGVMTLKEINEKGEEINSTRYETEGNTVKLTIEDSPSFKLIKKDGETKQVLPGVKFAIYNVEEQVPARNSKGEIIGTKEIINGREYYVVETDINGEIVLDLPEGLYKAVEVQADEKYNIENKTYTFGIGGSREGKEELGIEWREEIIGDATINSSKITSDGGYIVGGEFNSESITVGNYTFTNKSDMSKRTPTDGMVMKYSAEGKVEWATSIGGAGEDFISLVAQTSDGGYIVGGSFGGTSITVGDYTFTNVDLTIDLDAIDVLLIKYSAEGKIEWATSFGDYNNDRVKSLVATTDGGWIVGVNFPSFSSITVGDYTLTFKCAGSKGALIKYSAKGEVEWAKTVANEGGKWDTEIELLSETSDGGYIVGGSFNSQTITIGDYILENKSDFTGNGDIVEDDVFIAKYSARGEVEWATSVGGNKDDKIELLSETSDGGYIVGGYFESESITVGDYTFTNKSDMSQYSPRDAILIKYKANGEIEWATSVGGNGTDYINSVTETSDGGYIVGGTFESESITVGNYTITNEGIQDGILIKYSARGEVEWATSVGGTKSDAITSVTVATDGGYIVGGYFYSSSITVGDYTLTNAGSRDVLLIKYSARGEVEWATSVGGKDDELITSILETDNGNYVIYGTAKTSIIKFGYIELNNPTLIQSTTIGGKDLDSITSVTETSDGGYIVGGYFDSSSITVGDYTLTNAGSRDGMLIKYNATGEVEWATSVGRSITSVTETSDGGYIVGGKWNSINGMLIKYGANGEIEWATSVGASIASVTETSDGSYIVGGSFESESITVGDYIITNEGYQDGMLIKYNATGEVEWATSVGGKTTDYINSVTETSDGSYIVGGAFYSSSITVGDYTLTSAGSKDGMLIKYSARGEVEWATSVEGIIDSVTATTDGGYIVGGYLISTIMIGDYKLTTAGSRDGMLIKYSARGEVEWATSVGGNTNDEISSVAETRDGGYIVEGEFYSDSIIVGGYTLTNTGNADGMLIKYSARGEVEWATSVGGDTADFINSVTETTDGSYIAVGSFKSNTIEKDGHILENAGDYDGMILKIANVKGVPEIQELTVENERKEFKITTKVEQIDGIKGGSISGENISKYETVKYGDTSTKEIKMIPDENYEIIKITINGEEILDYNLNSDGSYILPQFTNMTEDKHIVVTYARKSNKITIIKQDKEKGTPLSDTTFKLDQIEERTEPKDVIGDKVDNGETRVNIKLDKNKEVTSQVLGELTSNGTYYFVEQEGKYVPTNGKTYQVANVEGATSGKASSTAYSYIKIDLSNLEGNYGVVLNTNISSENNYDYGYATITKTTDKVEYSKSEGRFVYETGTTDTTAKEHISQPLEGNNVYYLHLGYRKDGSGDKGEDQIKINSINVYEGVAESETYNFVSNNQGGYESNNQGVASSTANSYIPIDLTNLTGKYNLTVNANISSQSSKDYGYATITTTTDRVEYNTSAGRFIYISGEISAKDYTTVLSGGQMYYLHLGYRKDASVDTGEDKFTINSINVTLNNSELYHIEITTNQNGEAITQIPYGKYSITETKTPKGYEPLEKPIIVDFRSTGNNIITNENKVLASVNDLGEFVIENQEKGKVIVHHYLKTEEGTYTTTKLAEDEYMEGRIGEKYSTEAHLDLEKYELEKDGEGKYVVPVNATGTYESGTIEVKYYYEEKEIPLTVHHYIEGTEEKVLLSNGKTAEDEKYSEKEGIAYTTNSLTEEELNEKYELVGTPTNATGIYEGKEIIVTYYYKVKEVEIITKIEGEGGNILGEGQKPYETVKYGENSEKHIKATPKPGYQVSKITINGQEIEFTANVDKSVELEKFINMKENKEVVVSFEKIPANVIIHHYIYDKETGATTEKVPSRNGGVVEEEIKNGKVGDMYVTKEAENKALNYKYVSNTDNASGEMTEETIEVIYYYQLQDGKITENTVQKTGTEKITKENEEVNYVITYNATIDEYIGNAEIKIVDKLPYEIDEGKSNIMGGKYNASEKTITWTERVENIDTYTEGKARKIEIIKNITLVYVNMDYSKTSFDNKVKGTISLELTKQTQETPEVIKTTQTEFTKEVEVTKEWDHTNNIYGNPTRVILQVKNGEEVVQEQEVSVTNNWRHTFTNLAKYNNKGEEIDYQVGEREVVEGELKYYKTEIDNVRKTIKNTYIGPVITASKEIKTEENLSYVVEGEKITYTIRLQNKGTIEGEATVKDTIPTGTTFVEGSIKVNGLTNYEGEDLTTKQATDLENGIKVKIPGKTAEKAGETTLSFEVRVDKITEATTQKNITNTAMINKIPNNPDEPTNTVEIPMLVYSKKAEIIRRTTEPTNPEGITDTADSLNGITENKVEEIPEGTVTAGDRIKYTITINNVGKEEITNVEIKDRVPEGTKVYKINDNGEIGLNDTNEITWNIDVIRTGEEREVSFEVTVNYDTKEKTITNVGTVDEKETNRVETPYKPSKETVESSIVKEGTGRITSTEETMSYTINYKATIKDFVGKGKLKIVDKLPYEIDEEKSNIMGGVYNSIEKTITWEEDLGKVDTYLSETGTIVERTKTIVLKYVYTDEEHLSGIIENTAEGTITLTQEEKKENPENPGEPMIEEVVKKEEKVEDKHEVQVEIPAKVIVHHYIYDEEKGGATTERVPSREEGRIADEIISGIVGEIYTTKATEKAEENYECINITPEGHEGTMTKGDIEVKYYYKLKDTNIKVKTEKTATASKQEEKENKIVEVLTKEDGVVTYKIKYETEISNYKGKAKIKIVDKLPANIEELDERISLDGGTYNAENRTITWEEMVDVNTTTTGEKYTKTIEKTISLVYEGQNVLETLINEVTGTVTTYYPKNHTTNPEGERKTEISKDTAEVEQEYKIEKQVEKVWEDNGNKKGRRPESVTIQLTANKETSYNGKELEKVILNEGNQWRYTFTNLPKYDDRGIEIVYSVKETETKVGDLEYYDTAEIVEGTEKIIVTNRYKLSETDIKSSIEKTGTEKITSTNEKVSYKVKYTAPITKYIGEVLVKITDTLPYEIDEGNSELSGGIYNSESKTITWEERIPHINTYTQGDYAIEINKEIKIAYRNINPEERKITNNVKGRIELYETEQTKTVEDNHETKVEIPGKVIVKYLEKETGKEIEKSYEINGIVGEEYKTELKEIYGYKCVENTGNTEGKIIEGTIEVIYYYEKIPSGGVHVTYKDETGKEIAEDETYTGKVKDPYKTEEKEIYGYELIEVQGNPEGEMKEELIEVVYVYKKIPAKVIVRYLEKDETPDDDSDNKVLMPEEIKEGNVGDDYTTIRKTIENYQPAEPEPENKEGKMTKEDIYVTYYYEKIPSGKVIVQYIDSETGKEILYKEEETGEYKTYKEEIQGYIGEEYKTEQKEIPYYEFVSSTENTIGVLKQTDEKVIYYYRKQIFNIAIDKTIEEISLNGEKIEVDSNKQAKLEIKTSQIENANIIVKYNIKVRNTGEIRGTAKIVERIPEGYEVIEENEWTRNADGELERKIGIEAQEEINIKISLRWKNSSNNFGTGINVAEIIDLENGANFKETEITDNVSNANMIISIKTGEEINMTIAGMIITALGISAIIMVALGIDIKKGGPFIKKIKFLE